MNLLIWNRKKPQYGVQYILVQYHIDISCRSVSNSPHCFYLLSSGKTRSSAWLDRNITMSGVMRLSALTFNDWPRVRSQHRVEAVTRVEEA